MLEFAKELNELLYTGDSPFADMAMYYQGMDAYYENAKEANLTNLELARQQRDMYEDLWRKSGATRENMDQWTEDQKLYYKYWQEGQSELNRLTLEGAKLLKENYLYEMQKVMNDLENTLTNGKGFEQLQKEWDRIKEKSDKYYDDIEKVYEVESLANKFDAEINKTTGLKNQQKLKKVRDQLIGQLRDINDLTEYDLKVAEARYDIELKQLALEDARNNKNSVKLVRNDQGNWSYQYVSDINEMESKQQDLLDSWNKLYQLSSDAYQANLEAKLKLDKEYYEEVERINTNEKLNAEQKDQLLRELETNYYKDSEALAEENSKIRQNLEIATTGVLITTYNNDKDAYEGMTQEEQDLVDSLSQHKIDQASEVEQAVKDNYDGIKEKTEETLKLGRQDWNSTAQTIMNDWNADNGSIRRGVQDAFLAMGQARLNFQGDLDELQTRADVDFKNIGGYMNAVGDIISGTDNSLATKISKLRELGQSEIAELNKSVLSLRDHWGLVKTAIEDNLRLIDEYMQKQKQVNEAPAPSPTLPNTTPVDTRTAQDAAPSTPGGNPGGSTNGTPSGPTSSPAAQTPKPTMKDSGFKLVGLGQVRQLSSTSWADTYELRNNKGTRIKQIEVQGENLIKRNQAASAAINKWFNELSASSSYKTTYSGTGFATGGYTGSWNDNSGRWAMLHQKELVLNKEDTENFLSGIKMIRDMSSINGSINKAIIQSIATVISNIAGTSLKVPGTGNTNSNQNQVFNITAEFPNANDVNEIREAILSLPNLAAQYVMSKEMD